MELQTAFLNRIYEVKSAFCGIHPLSSKLALVFRFLEQCWGYLEQFLKNCINMCMCARVALLLGQWQVCMCAKSTGLAFGREARPDVSVHAPASQVIRGNMHRDSRPSSQKGSWLAGAAHVPMVEEEEEEFVKEVVRLGREDTEAVGRWRASIWGGGGIRLPSPGMVKPWTGWFFWDWGIMGNLVPPQFVIFPVHPPF